MILAEIAHKNVLIAALESLSGEYNSRRGLRAEDNRTDSEFAASVGFT